MDMDVEMEGAQMDTTQDSEVQHPSGELAVLSFCDSHWPMALGLVGRQMWAQALLLVCWYPAVLFSSSHHQQGGKDPR